MCAMVGLFVGVILEVLIGVGALLAAVFAYVKTKTSNCISVLQNINKKRKNHMASHNYASSPGCKKNTSDNIQPDNKQNSGSKIKEYYNQGFLLGIPGACILTAIIVLVATWDYHLAAATVLFSLVPILIFVSISYLVSKVCTVKKPELRKSTMTSAMPSPHQETRMESFYIIPDINNHDAHAYFCYGGTIPSAPPAYDQNASLYSQNASNSKPHQQQPPVTAAYIPGYQPYFAPMPSTHVIRDATPSPSNLYPTHHLEQLSRGEHNSFPAGTCVTGTSVHYHTSDSCDHFKQR